MNQDIWIRLKATAYDFYKFKFTEYSATQFEYFSDGSTSYDLQRFTRY